MKRLLLLSLCVLLLLPGCQPETFPSAPEMIQFYEGDATFLNETVSFSGKDYQIEFACTNEDEWGNFTRLKGSVNGASVETEVFSAYQILDAYLADLHPEDGGVEVFFLTDEGSADLTLRAYQYNDDTLTPIPFEQFGNREDALLAGWNYDGCSLTEDGTLSLTVATPSYGMWGIKMNYRLKDGVFYAEELSQYEVNMEKYAENIAPFHALRSFVYAPDESEKMMEGYFIARASYELLEEGEYFTVLYDDGKDNIYVKTEDGTEGWIPVPRDYDLRERINPDLFFLAG